MKMLRLFLVLLGTCASVSAYASARQCPQCKEKILDSNRFCPHCGWSFVEQEPVPQPTPRPAVPAPAPWPAAPTPAPQPAVPTPAPQPAVAPEPIPMPVESPVQEPVQVPVQQPSPDPYYPAMHSRYEHGRRRKYSSSSALDRLGGTGRGLTTAALSPLNVFRGMVTGLSWTEAIVNSTKLQDGQAIMYLAMLTVPAGTAFSSFAICADAINGTLDMVSLGYYGDRLYESKSSGRPTPWIWEREWKSNKIPWINRK